MKKIIPERLELWYYRQEEAEGETSVVVSLRYTVSGETESKEAYRQYQETDTLQYVWGDLCRSAAATESADAPPDDIPVISICIVDEIKTRAGRAFDGVIFHMPPTCDLCTAIDCMAEAVASPVLASGGDSNLYSEGDNGES